MKKDRFAFVDFLKVVAIFLVILFHLLYQITPNNSLRIVGFFGVSLFFIISGFVLAKNYPGCENFSIKWFFNRYAKLSIMYYSALILIVVLFFTQSYSGNIFLNLFSHFLFVESFFTEYSYGIISPAWFLAPLLVYYFVFPFLNKMVKKSWIFIILIFAFSIFTKFILQSYTSSNILFFLAEFCFGIALAYKNKFILLGISFVSAIVNPLMFLTFLTFFMFSFVENKYFEYSVIRFVSNYTLPLFLFHEALIYLIFNRWVIYSVPKYFAIPLYIVSVLLIVFVSNKLQRK